MAAIFQIRRGTSNITISDGELYLNKGIGSIQFGSGSTPVTLVRLDQPNSGSLNIGGNITASSAYFSGDVAISGNLFLGNASNDTITAGGEFTSNLIPNPTNTYTLGSSTKIWKEVHATSISGAIAATNGVISGSSQIIQSLPSGLVSGSSQVNFTQLSNISSNIVSASSDTANVDIIISNGSISANLYGGVFSGSAQVVGILSSLNAYTASNETINTTQNSRLDQLSTDSGSQNTRITTLENKATTLQTYTASVDSTIARLRESTASINLTTASLNGHVTDINLKTGSFETKFNSIQISTASLNTFTASANSRLNDIEAYTSSLKTAIGVSGQNVTIAGNLTVAGTTTAVNSTTVQLGDNIIELNGNGAVNGGLWVKDPTSPNTATGSIIWDSTNDYWKAGVKDAESKILLAGGDSVVSSSAQVVGILQSLNTFSSSQDNKNTTLAAYTASVDGKFNAVQIVTSSLNSATASLYSYTASLNNRLNRIEESTSSLNTFSASQNVKDETLRLYTASVDSKFTTLQTYTASVDSKFTTLQTYTASVDSKILRIQESTASLNLYTQSNDTTNTTQNTRLSRLEESTASLNTFSASINGHVSDINIYTSSINGHVADINAWTGSQKEKDTTLENVTSSLNLITASFNTWTGSTYNTFSTSVDSRLDDVEYTVTVLDPGNIGNALLGINAFTESANSRLNNLEATTSSLNSFSSSINNTIKTKLDTDSVISGSSQVSYVGLSNIPSGIISSSTQIDTLFNIDGLVSGSSQIIPLLPVGTVSGSSQVSYNGLSNIPSGIISSSTQIDALFNVDGLVSGSSQIDATATTNWATGIKTQLNSNTVISGSSQVSYNGLSNIPAGIISSSAQIDTLFNIDGLVSGSSQVSYVGLSNIPGGIVSGSSQVSYTALSNIPGGIVSGSIQILGGSNILSGSNQTNITSINQNLGTSTTGVQFASLGIGTAPDATYELKIAGDIAASGDIVAYYTSDKRLKDNIQPIENALDRVNQLGGYTFDWNEELQKARKGHDIGVIAQEVQSTFPEVVVERENGYLGVDYQKLVPVLIEAIKELSAKVKELENK
jgi:hypothetical protein